MGVVWVAGRREEEEPERAAAADANGLPLCAIWGAVLLVTCDLLARVLFFPYELPAGLLLSLLGAPFFIMLLMRRRRPR